MCKVKGCTNDHSVHYCKVCKSKDSDHFSSVCPQAQQNKNYNTQNNWGYGYNTNNFGFGLNNYNHCKVPNCPENHTTHYCRVCKQKDVDHLASKCPVGDIFYHGTTRANAEIIAKTQLKPSTSGCLGAGIYFTHDFEEAKKIAISRGGGQGSVLQCQVYNDNNGGYMKNGDHGPWCGINYTFKQFCAQDSTRLRLIKVINV